MPLRNNFQCLILGGQGKGKSSLGRLMFATHVLDENRDSYVLVSTKADAIDPPIPKDGKPVYEIFLLQLGFEPLAVTEEMIEDGFDVAAVLDEYPRSIFCLKGTSPEATDEFMTDLSKGVLDYGSAVLLVDEAERFLPAQRRGSFGLLNLVRQGRYKGVDIIAISHTDSALHHEVAENANALVAFAIRHATRIERLKHWFDDPNVLAELGPFEYILVDEVTNTRIRRTTTDDFVDLRRACPEVFVPVPREELRERCPQLYE